MPATPSNATALFALHDDQLIVVKSRNTTCPRSDLPPAQAAQVDQAEALLCEVFGSPDTPSIGVDSLFARRAVYSVREAMQAAGVPNWQMGGGVSSADAVRYIAAQRDQAQREVRLLVSAIVCLCAAVISLLWVMN